MSKVPPLKKFNLPQLLGIVEPMGCQREHLIEHLQAGDLHAVCYHPYRHEPDRVVPIEPDQWLRLYPQSYGFSVYYGWLSDEDISELGRKFPLHIVPDAIDELCDEVDEEGRKIVTAAVVYVMRDELLRFVAWLNAETTDTDTIIDNFDDAFAAPNVTGSRSHRGAPPKHDYTDIDEKLTEVSRRQGKRAFKRVGPVISYLKSELGEENLPYHSTLDSHIREWKKKHILL